jgi:carbonic anhydrase
MSKKFLTAIIVQAIALAVLAAAIMGMTALIKTSYHSEIAQSESSVEFDSEEKKDSKSSIGEITSPQEAKKLLFEGNKRYAIEKISKKEINKKRRKEISENGQKPFAQILSCSDSRVPPEIIFDQGLGDLFVIRDAGNVVDPVILGSLEYGAEHLKTPLIVVLGHEKCGAVNTTVEAEGEDIPPNINSIVELIKPAFNTVKSLTKNKEELIEKCVEQNIKNSMSNIMKSTIIKHLEEQQKLEVVGAKYDLDSGLIKFFE